jgi:phosphate/sulfate permease
VSFKVANNINLYSEYSIKIYTVNWSQISVWFWTTDIISAFFNIKLFFSLKIFILKKTCKKIIIPKKERIKEDYIQLRKHNKLKSFWQSLILLCLSICLSFILNLNDINRELLHHITYNNMTACLGNTVICNLIKKTKSL